jgi:hypothetical protein
MEEEPEDKPAGGNTSGFPTDRAPGARSTHSQSTAFRAWRYLLDTGFQIAAARLSIINSIQLQTPVTTSGWNLYGLSTT